MTLAVALPPQPPCLKGALRVGLSFLFSLFNSVTINTPCKTRKDGELLFAFRECPFDEALGSNDRRILLSAYIAIMAANCLDILLAIILPPLGVFLKFGCNAEFWICLLLTILGYIPGIIYAVYAITK
jgi:uncharacterized membrane protein YqaE (UPF0057 family)